MNTPPCSFSASTAGDNGNIYRIANKRDDTRTQNFTYDSLNRIQQAYSSGTQWGETFAPTATSPGVAPATPGIDARGNLTNRSGVTGKTSYEPLSVSAGSNNQLSGFGYDTAGDMITNTSINASYVYDAENRLIWTSGYRYLYDGNGERVEKCVAANSTTACPTSGASGTLYWKGAGSAALSETDLSGTVQNTYIFFNGQRVARSDSAGVHYYFSDHLGSHGVVENATGSACEQDIDYYPYGGQEHDYCPNLVQNYKFNGKERDSESGLDNFGARYDASSLGRFMTPDWAARPTTVPYAVFGDPQSLNLYGYVRNDPVSRADADGHANHCADHPCNDGIQELLNEAASAIAKDKAEGRLPVCWCAQKPRRPNKPKSQKQVAGTIYNETSTLRPSAKKGAGSTQNLHDARVAMAQVLEVNHSKEKVAPSTVRDNLKNPDAAAAMKDSRLAAAEATTAPDGTNGATHFYLDAGQSAKQDWYNQGEIEETSDLLQ